MTPLATLYCPMPPSPNRTRGQHWSLAAKRRTALQSALALAVLAVNPRPAALTKPARRRLVLTREVPIGGRNFDCDNLVAACKPVVDALKVPRGRQKHGLSLIWDDGEKWLDAEYRQRKSQLLKKFDRDDYGSLKIEVYECR